MIEVRVGLGQDTHAFADAGDQPLLLGGLAIPGGPPLMADSDGDVVLHAVTRAIDTLLGTDHLGAGAETLHAAGIVDSRAYLQPALAGLAAAGFRITHLAVAIEAQRPRLRPHFPAMRASLAELLGVSLDRVGVAAETGDSLGGRGIRVLALLTVVREVDESEVR